jgi:hypothetical protein
LLARNCLVGHRTLIAAIMGHYPFSISLDPGLTFIGAFQNSADMKNAFKSLESWMIHGGKLDDPVSRRRLIVIIEYHYGIHYFTETPPAKQPLIENTPKYLIGVAQNMIKYRHNTPIGDSLGRFLLGMIQYLSTQR